MKKNIKKFEILFGGICSEELLNKEVVNLEKFLTLHMNKYLQIKGRDRKHVNWWTPALDSQRRILRVKRKSFQIINISEAVRILRKTDFKKEKAKYKKLVKKTKIMKNCEYFTKGKDGYDRY